MGFHADLPLIQSRDQMHTLDDRHTGISEAPIPARPFLMQLPTNMHTSKNYVNLRAQSSRPPVLGLWICLKIGYIPNEIAI